jgi:hypothetical protein
MRASGESHTSWYDTLRLYSFHGCDHDVCMCLGACMERFLCVQETLSTVLECDCWSTLRTLLLQVIQTIGRFGGLSPKT